MPCSVRVLHGSGEGLDERGGLTRRLRRLAQVIAEALSGHKFQREKKLAIMLPDFDDLHDVGVTAAPSVCAFAKPLAGGWIGQINAGQ